MLITNRFVATGLFVVGLLLAGCGSGGASLTTPPEGWETAGEHWWRAGTDTAAAFRDFSTLQAMEVAEGGRTYVAGVAQLSGAQLERAIKEKLIALYRHAPRVVDSLFVRYVAPGLEGRSVAGEEALDELRAESYDAIRAHFREPRQALTLGEDIPVIFPDTLRQEGVSGQVEMQVHLNAEGVPQAARLVEGVHPTLNAIALRAATQMRWEPANVEVEGAWEPIPSWVRFGVYFRQPPA